MPAYCAALGCNARHQKGEKISFHSFPFRDPKLLSDWLRALGREDMEPKVHHRVCSQHFKPSCFYAGLDRPCLRPDAVPTEFTCSPKLPAPAKETASRRAPTHHFGTRAATKVANQTAAEVGGSVPEKSGKVSDEAPRGRGGGQQQALPKKHLFQLRHEARQMVAIQPKDKDSPVPMDTGGPASASNDSTLQLKPEGSSESPSSSEPQPKELLAAGGTTNGATSAALSLHSYCGVHSKQDHVAKLKYSLHLAKKKLIAADRKIKRKNNALAQLQATVDDLKSRLAPLESNGDSSSGGPQQRFCVSERLPQELFRDWHENAGRVPHARRYSAMTLHFAAELHSCSRIAYEHVARWLPMPTLYVVRKSAAAVGDITGPLPASRFASSLPRKRIPTTEEAPGDASTVPTTGSTVLSTSSPPVPGAATIVTWAEEEPPESPNDSGGIRASDSTTSESK